MDQKKIPTVFYCYKHKDNQRHLSIFHADG